jgi:DNA-binding NarL/FixJ family response regulator
MNEKTSPLTILLADDHALFRDGMCHILRQLESDVILFETANHPAAMEMVARHPEIDLALVDLHLPSRDGTELFEALLCRSQTVPVVVLSATEDAREIRRVLEAGAMGFIPKSEAVEVMLGALRLVLSGGVYVPPLLVRSAGLPKPTELTPRQNDVLRGLARGKSNREIGGDLGLSEATVKVHVTAIFKCLNVSNRNQAVKLAEQRGLVRAQLPDPLSPAAIAVSAE